MAITSFRGENSFLSNFHECKILYQGLYYRNAEAAFQAQKCRDPKDQISFKILNGYEAKKLGRQVPLRDDWESLKHVVMAEILHSKFTQHKNLRQALTNTGEQSLVEGNNWGDTIWGVDTTKLEGENWLGKLLMAERAYWQKLESIASEDFTICIPVEEPVNATVIH